MMPFMPSEASAHAGRLDFFIVAVHAVIITAFVGWFIWYVIALFRFRKSKNPVPNVKGIQSKLPFVAVALASLAEFTLLFGWSIPFWHEEIAAVPLDDPNVFHVRVVGQQFQWNMHYPGPDGVFGRTDPSFIESPFNEVGLDPDDPAGEDDITTIGKLYLPVNRQVIVELSTKDMIHSFFLPEFRIKQDAVPGMRIPIYFTPTKSTKEFQAETGDDTRNFEIACAQLCGINHFQMRGFVYVVDEAEFKAWYDKELETKREYADDDWDDF
jgi:cytochrome c oxidase subunit 2